MNDLLTLPNVASIVSGKPYATETTSLVIDPSLDNPVARLSHADDTIVERAVEAASAAFKTWRDVTPAQRARCLMRFRDIVDRNRQELAAVIVREHGKPTADAMGSIDRGLEVVEFAMGAPHLLKGENSDHVGTGVATRSSRRPLGVCAGVVPFNYPAMIPMWMFPMALACGNTFILKPSEKTPSAANMIAQMLAEAGVPEGVFSVLHGGREVAEALISHPDVAAVSFVGSSAVAKSVYQTATRHGKRVQALGGAKNHAIVMPDADMKSTVDAILSGAFNSAGQRCMAISVLVTVAQAHDQLMPALVEAASHLKLAAGKRADCFVPPVNSADQYQRILQHIDNGIEEGASLRLDGRQGSETSKGFFIGPVIFDDVTPAMSIYQQEIFGPVLVVMQVDDLDEAIELSNNHALGNGAVIFTSSGKSANTFERDILCGMPGVNVPVPSPVAYHSFGGTKQSLYGDLAVHGPDGINFYTRRQVLTTRWP
ncbi:CoA-acylating methylmalonate-semialdehyde dehydrogenase [Hoeflea sp. G2-23]|uniref:methylmalonate-semialdehyde dehydrogenase (CoA acylating) n=2 Tax=Hoeflea algicola TaxID=2983763 RepID=A0ABT3ZFT0_9HYPH|nr:CoA-acylating methylmalonate-semialdehyde dehydrogenase [Hoeflea algicola]